MSWRKKFTDNAADILRFAGYVFLFLDAIILSIFTLWFVTKFIWRFAEWLNKVLFDNPW